MHSCKLVWCSSLFQSQHPALYLFLSYSLFAILFPKRKGKRKIQKASDSKSCVVRFAAYSFQKESRLYIVQRSMHFSEDMAADIPWITWVCFISTWGQINSYLPGKSGTHSVIVHNNSVKEAEKITLFSINITRVYSSRIRVYWIWKLIFKCLPNLRITNNFSLQWSQIPHFLSFHFYLLQNKYEKIITLFLYHWAKLSAMYILIHQHQEACK